MESNSLNQQEASQLASLTLLHTPCGESKSPTSNSTQRTFDGKHSADHCLRQRYKLSTGQYNAYVPCWAQLTASLSCYTSGLNRPTPHLRSTTLTQSDHNNFTQTLKHNAVNQRADTPSTAPLLGN